MHTPRHHHSADAFAVKLLRNELIYDIDFVTNRIAKMRFTDEDIKKASSVTSEGEENQDWLDDTIMSALNNVSQKLRFCHISHSRLSTDEVRPVNSEDEGVIFNMALNLPKWRGSAESLARFIHEYIVNYTLSEWFLMTMADISPVYAEKANRNLTQIVNESRNADIGTPVYRL